MRVEILRCFKSNGYVYGEYYVHDSNGRKELVFQNGTDIKVITHFNGKKVEDCVVGPTLKVIEAVMGAATTYLQEREGNHT